MRADTSQFLASLAFLAVASILTSSLLFWLHRLYRRGYLRHWRTSWAWLASYHGLATVSLWRAESEAPLPFSAALALSALVRVAACLHIFYFLFGA